MATPALRILAATNNARGDLLTRLVKDLFFALGYDDLRLNVATNGRRPQAMSAWAEWQDLPTP